MNPMHAAIKARLGKHSAADGSSPAGHEYAGAEHTPDHASEGKDLHGFVASLSDGDKNKLKSILSGDGSNSQAIANGGPSTDEQNKIAQAMHEENQANAAEEMDESAHGGISEDESDEIGKSMLDSRHLNGMATDKPKNLGERAKHYIAAKLKAKGKI